MLLNRLALSYALLVPALAKPTQYAPTSDISIGKQLQALKQPYYPPNAVCSDYMIPVSLSYDNFEFNATKFANNFDVTNFGSVATTRAGADFPPAVDGPIPVTASYNIAASFCTPKQQTAKAKNVIVATHGIGPARAHWNSPFQPDDFNFVQHAVGQGYSVFFYDRVGCGASDKGSGYTNSLFTAIEVLKSLVAQVKTGSYTGAVGIPSKVAVMGFSFGSFATHSAIATQPDLADAVVLTAIGFNSSGLDVNGLVRSFVPRIANIENPALFSDLDTGYVTWPDQFNLIWNYFKQPNFQPATAEFVEAAKAPFAITEFLTLLSGQMDASNYTGSVLAISGEYDYIVCDGFCPGIFDEPAQTFYKNAKFTPYIHPGASHHINFHNNATAAFTVITDFLSESGLN